MEIKRDSYLEQLISYCFDGLDLLCSSVGSLTNPTKIANTLTSKQGGSVSANTIRAYIGHLEENSGGKRTYIQSAYAMPTDEKAEVELRSFTLIGDFFPKIVVRKDIGKRWYDDNGILNINVIDFLLDKKRI